MSNKATVIFVDDNPNVLKALARSFRNEAFDVLTFDSGLKVLDHLSRQQVDVIVTDENMPSMNGTELLQTVKEKYPSTFRIMLTGKASLETAMQAVNLGEVYRFFSKPYDEIDLSHAIKLAIKKRRELIANSNGAAPQDLRNDELDSLEREYPGISQVQRDSSGSIVIDTAPDDFNLILKELIG